MKKILPFLFILSACVPAGYVKDPNKQTATKQDVVNLERDMVQSMQQLYNSLVSTLGPKPSPTPAPTSAPVAK